MTSRTKAWATVWLACILAPAACRRAPESLAMPAQKAAPRGSDPRAVLLTFSDPASNEYIVRDISSWPGKLRWTFEHPELRIPVEPHAGLRFELIFHVARETLHNTGPVTLTVTINGHLLGRMRCVHEGRYRFDQPVPQQWVHAGERVQVLAEASPLWTSPQDGARLGYLIEEAGFRW